MGKKCLTIQKRKTKKSQNTNQKKLRFIQLFIPHCTAMCQSKGQGSDQSQARKMTSGCQDIAQGPTVVWTRQIVAPNFWIKIGGLNSFCQDSIVRSSWPHPWNVRWTEVKSTLKCVEEGGWFFIKNAYMVCSGCKNYHCDNVVTLEKKNRFNKLLHLLCYVHMELISWNMKPCFEYLSSLGRYLFLLYVWSALTNQERTDVSSEHELGYIEKIGQMKCFNANYSFESSRQWHWNKRNCLPVSKKQLEE